MIYLLLLLKTFSKAVSLSKKKICLWVSHEHKEVHLTKRIDICDLLMKLNRNDTFFNPLISGDEKWVVYNNVN